MPDIYNVYLCKKRGAGGAGLSYSSLPMAIVTHDNKFHISFCKLKKMMNDIRSQYWFWFNKASLQTFCSWKKWVILPCYGRSCWHWGKRDPQKQSLRKTRMWCGVWHRLCRCCVSWPPSNRSWTGISFITRGGSYVSPLPRGGRNISVCIKEYRINNNKIKENVTDFFHFSLKV